jgi:hypothetical protein
VAGHEGRRLFLEAAGFQGGLEAGEADGHDRWLGIDCLAEGVLGPLKAETAEGQAKRFVGFLEDAASGGKGLVQVKAHSYLLRALAGEDPR